MTISINATVEPANTPPRVRLDISGTTETAATVMRLNPDGNLVPVRTQDGNPQPLSAGAAVLYDYEPPFGQALQYTSLETPGSFTLQVTLNIGVVWLIHPGVPSLSQPIRLGRGSFTQRTRRSGKATFWPQGRSTPLTVGDGARKSVASQVVVATATQSQSDALDALLADSSTLLLNIPATLGYNFKTCYISVEDTTGTVLSPLVVETYMATTLPFTVTSRPAGGSQSQRTLADLLDLPTLAAIKTKYATLLDVLTGP